jgi:hypothetical protein
LRRLWRLCGWFVVVEALITVFGVSTIPLLLSIALDAAVGLLVIRSYGDACSGLRRLCAGRQFRLSGRRRLMLGFMLSQLALRVLSAVLGGYGIFCLIMSFAVPEVGAQALILLVTATAIVYLCGSGRTS